MARVVNVNLSIIGDTVIAIILLIDCHYRDTLNLLVIGLSERR